MSLRYGGGNFLTQENWFINSVFFQILQTNIYLSYSFSDKIKIFLFTTDDITGLGHRIITTYRSYSYRKHVIAADLHWSGFTT